MRTLFSGILIGIACILPGASGGVLAVAFGLYRPALDALMNFFREPGRHLRFLAPLAAGGAAGVLLGAFCLSGVMARYERLMLFLFTGLVAGGIPDLMREAQQNGPFQISWLLSLAVGVLIALPLCFLGGAGSETALLSPAQAFIVGILEGIGTVVPGVSTSFVLIRLGWYQAYLQALSAFDPPRLSLITAGFALSAYACMRAAQRLFDRCTGHAFYGVLGFLLVSVALVFPGFEKGAAMWADGGLLVIGTVLARWIGKPTKE